MECAGVGSGSYSREWKKWQQGLGIMFVVC
jgi:hypothetical protein